MEVSNQQATEEDFSEELDRANTTIVEMGKVIERLQKELSDAETEVGQWERAAKERYGFLIDQTRQATDLGVERDRLRYLLGLLYYQGSPTQSEWTEITKAVG